MLANHYHRHDANDEMGGGMKLSKARPDWQDKSITNEFDEYAKQMFGE